MKLKLIVIPGSHPCATVEAALRLKGLAYTRTDLLPVVHIGLGLLTHGARTVPGLRITPDVGPVERVAGSRAILRRLDELEPAPALLPEDPTQRGRILDIEEWGDVVFQQAVREISDGLIVRRPMALESYVGDARLPLPVPLLRPSLPLVGFLLAANNQATDARVRARLAVIPAQLDTIDGWMADGTLGGAQINRADLQLGASLRLLQSFGDVRPLLHGRPSERLIDLFPPLAGHFPAGALPSGWVPTAPAAAPA